MQTAWIPIAHFTYNVASSEYSPNRHNRDENYHFLCMRATLLKLLFLHRATDNDDGKNGEVFYSRRKVTSIAVDGTSEIKDDAGLYHEFTCRGAI